MVQPCVCFITTFIINCADKGDSHAPAVNIIVLGELFTTVENISNLLPAFKCKGEGRISLRSTPVAAALDVEFVWVDCEYAYLTSPNGKPEKVKVMTSMANTGSSMIHCFILQYCIWDVYLTVSPYYLYLSVDMKL